MQKIFWLFIIVLTLDGCKKCISCKNECKICTDSHFRIRVCSDKLTQKYYKEYVDSLTSTGLGWTCVDTASDSSIDKCVTKNVSQEKLFLSEGGYTCTDK